MSILKKAGLVALAILLTACPWPPRSGSSAEGDRAAQADLRQALLTEKVYYTDNETFLATPRELAAIEPSLRFGTIRQASRTVVGVNATRNEVVLVMRAPSGTYLCISDSISREVGYGRSQRLTDVDTPGECTGKAW